MQGNIVPEPNTLEIFSDYTWPWCYFITGSIEKLQKDFKIDIRWTAFPLRPNTPEDGQTLKTLFECSDADVDQMSNRLKLVAQGFGLPFGHRTMTYNSRLAQEMGKWAESEGQGHEFHTAVFQAYFVDGLNIGKPHILVKVAESVNLNGKEAMDTVLSRTYREAVDRDWERSKEKCVTAAPTFVFNDQVLVGAQKYEALEKVLVANKIKRRKS